jgi:hypothetical protein
MNMTGEFVSVLDLGQLGEHQAAIEWDGYRAKVKAVDDYDTMEILRVSVDLAGSVIDVLPLLSDDDIDELKTEAWEKFPSLNELEEEAAIDAAEHWMQERLDRQFAMEV